eukprot:485276_1
MSRLRTLQPFKRILSKPSTINRNVYPKYIQLVSHSYLTSQTCTHHQSLTNNSCNRMSLFHLSQRFKRGAKGRKQAKEQEYDEGRPEKGLTLDSEDYKKRMQKFILKLQQQMREIQPRSANTCNKYTKHKFVFQKFLEIKRYKSRAICVQ